MNICINIDHCAGQVVLIILLNLVMDTFFLNPSRNIINPSNGYNFSKSTWHIGSKKPLHYSREQKGDKEEREKKEVKFNIKRITPN